MAIAAIRRELRLLAVAVQYFTRLPVPALRDFDPAWLSQSVRYFPVAGWIVGALGGVALWLCAQALPLPIAASIALAVSIAITGAFHEDGLADTFDALGGQVSRERALEIMRDSRIGTYGAAALGLSLLLRWQSLIVLPLADTIAMWFCAHAVARAGAASLMAGLPYVRLENDAKAKPVAQDVRLSNLLAALALGALPSALCIAWKSQLVWPVAAGLCATLSVRLACARWFRARLGGYTGDALGCCEQLGEIAFALAFIGVALRFSTSA